MVTMILENDTTNVLKYDESGIDRIFIDLETLGKKERQGHLDTVISDHKVSDIRKVKKILKNAQIITRINPINEKSLFEINEVIEAGTEIIMLPMFKTADEVEFFLNCVNKRVKTCLLLETAQALCRIDDILEIKGIDEIHIGLNDLHLALGLDFLFEPLTNGIVEYLANKIKKKDIPFGIGGVALMNEGKFNGKTVIKEHVRLGSSIVILSRTFKKMLQNNPKKLKEEINNIHEEVAFAKKESIVELLKNKKLLKSYVDEVIATKRTNNV